MAHPTFLLGRESSSHVSVTVTAREYSHVHDYWDGNWVYATVRASGGAFRGEYEALLRTDEFAALRKGLAHLHEKLEGTARFESMEEWLVLHIEGNRRGGLVATCEARDAAGNGNTLTFEISLDQTDLPAIVAGLDAILEAFPVRGHPGEPHG